MALKAKSRPSNSADLDEAIWEQAMDEVDSGWLVRCDDLDQLERFVGGKAIMSRRFPLKQKDKVRAIDDMSESLVNSSIAAAAKIDLMSVDVMAGLLRVLYKALSVGYFEWSLSKGTLLSGPVHSAWSCGSQVPDVLGCVLDLKSASKQLCVCCESRRYSALWILDQAVGVAMPFVQITLPFGARASVLGSI